MSKCSREAITGVGFCVVIVAAIWYQLNTLLLVPTEHNTNTLSHSTGALGGTVGVPGPGPMVFGVLRVGAGVILGYPRVRILSGIRLRLRDATVCNHSEDEKNIGQCPTFFWYY